MTYVNTLFVSIVCLCVLPVLTYFMVKFGVLAFHRGQQRFFEELIDGEKKTRAGG